MVSAIIGGVRTASFGASIGTAEAFSLLNRSLVIALPSLSMTIGPRGEEYVAVYVMTRIFGDSFRWLSDYSCDDAGFSYCAIKSG